MNVLRRLGLYRRSPLVMIESAIAFSSLIGGLYLLSPLLKTSIQMNGASPFVQTVASDLGITIFAVFFITTALVLLAGIVRDSTTLRSFGLFLNILARTYIIVAGWIAVGFLPLTWLGNATVLVISIIIWFKIRMEV